MKSDSLANDFSSVSNEKLLYVARKILSMAEISRLPNGMVIFDAQSNKLLLSEYQQVIRKLQHLELVLIWDERLKQDIPAPYPSQYVLTINDDNLRKLLDNLEGNIQVQSQKSISWPEYYKWDDTGLNYEVGDGKKLPFRSQLDFRWKVFDSLVKCKGQSVLVTTIADESGVKKESDVRIIISQLRKKINNRKLNKYLKIEPLGFGKVGIRGSYRITPA